MSFRQNNENNKNWRKWLVDNKSYLDKCGLPEVISESEAHWWDFLEHGYLDHHLDPSNFTIESLSSNQKEILFEFLSLNLTDSEKKSVLIFKEFKSESSKF